LRSSLQIPEVEQIIGQPFFPRYKLYINLDKKWVGQFLAIFSQTHLATLSPANAWFETKLMKADNNSFSRFLLLTRRGLEQQRPLVADQRTRVDATCLKKPPLKIKHVFSVEKGLTSQV
jgi:hypothetical protein